MNEKSTMAVSDRPSPASDADRLRLQRMFAVYHATIWRVLRRRGLSADAAADATQQSFLVAAERLADIAPESERAFLVATALRVARGLHRKTSRLELDDELDQRAGAGAADERVDVQLCDLALSKLNPELAEVFVLYEIEGFSSTEIATLLEIPLGSVASRLRRAREQFRAAVNRLERGVRGGERP
jgi:RNA polymerase sigma-70 factor (ECF subfamily)